MNTLDPKNIEMTREIGAYLEAQGGKTITARDLSTRFHIHPSRVRGCVSLGRTMGMPLCSNPTGYFWSFDQNDIRQTIAHIEDRIKKQQEAVIGLKEALGDPHGHQ